MEFEKIVSFSCFTFLIFFAIGFTFGQNNFSPNIRYHAAHPNVSLNYSYINLKHLKGYKLDVTPLATFSVNNRSLCAKECLLTKGACQSINTRKITNGWECETLATDIYSSRNQLIIGSDFTHSIIANKCLKNPCAEEEMCIPNYHHNTYRCLKGSCKLLKKTIPSLTSGFYDIFIAGSMRKAFCEMETDGGGWMLIGNYTVPSTQHIPPLNIGDLDSFQKLVTGNFLLDDEAYLPVMNAWFPINEFRFHCYKPSVGRMVDLVTNPMTTWGAYLNSFIVGKKPHILCNDGPPCGLESGLRALPNDESRLITGTNAFGFNGIAHRLYHGAFYSYGSSHIILQNRRVECDDGGDGSNVDGNWKFYVRY